MTKRSDKEEGGLLPIRSVILGGYQMEFCRGDQLSAYRSLTNRLALPGVFGTMERKVRLSTQIAWIA